jgi:peptidoglycan/LPS O-acetylase OafA/YrhL
MSSMKMPSEGSPVFEQGRVPSLDGLRAISILMVIYSHALFTCDFPSLPPQLQWEFIGSLGVKVFFVISGFIITTLLLKEERRHGAFSLRRFYLRRVLRIVPVYYCFLVAIMIVVAVNHLPVPNWEFIAAFTFTTGWFEGSWLLGHTWSLAVEEQFYILWPLCLLLSRSAKVRIRLCVVVLALLPLVRILVYVSPLSDRRLFLIITQGDGLMTGCLLACLLFYCGDVLRKYLTTHTQLIRVVLLVIIAALYVIQGRMVLGVVTVPFANSVEAVSIAWLLGSTIFNKDVLFSILNSIPLRFLGYISYSWYLWQQLFLVPCNRYFTAPLFDFPMNVLASLVVAVVSYFLIEKTCERIKKRWVE